MIKLIGYSLIAIMLITGNLLFSKTYYASPDGNDSHAGTMEAPFASVQKAHDAAQPGDTLVLRGGVYYPRSSTVFRKAGRSDARFVVRSFPGETPIINGEKIPEGNINHGSTQTWQFKGAKYWKIIGPITLTNGRGAGVIIDDGRFLEFDLVESSYNGKRASRAAHGFMIWRGSDILFNNCDAHHNANHLWKSGEDQEANQYQHGDGWRIFSGANIRLVGCRSWRNLDDNYDFYGAENPIELIDCWAAYAGRDDSLGSITGTPNRDMPLLDPWDLLWGNGIKLGYWEDGVRHRVQRCLSWGNNGAGFHMNQGPSQVLNAASYGNKVFGFDYTDGKKHEMHNNWEFGNDLDNPGYPQADPDLSLSSHNSWEDGVAVSAEDFVSLDDANMLGPRGPDGALPVADFLRLAAASDLIDAGVDVGLAYLGGAPDIGPFEFDGATSAPTPIVAMPPDDFELASYPNPFNPVAVVRYELSRAANVDVAVFDIVGRKVIQLDGGYRMAGVHTLSWNAVDDLGRRIASGTYLLRVRAGRQAKTIKMTFVQ